MRVAAIVFFVLALGLFVGVQFWSPSTDSKASATPGAWDIPRGYSSVRLQFGDQIVCVELQRPETGAQHRVVILFPADGNLVGLAQLRHEAAGRDLARGGRLVVIFHQRDASPGSRIEALGGLLDRLEETTVVAEGGIMLAGFGDGADLALDRAASDDRISRVAALRVPLDAESASGGRTTAILCRNQQEVSVALAARDGAGSGLASMHTRVEAEGFWAEWEKMHAFLVVPALPRESSLTSNPSGLYTLDRIDYCKRLWALLHKERTGMRVVAEGYLAKALEEPGADTGQAFKRTSDQLRGAMYSCYTEIQKKVEQTAITLSLFQDRKFELSGSSPDSFVASAKGTWSCEGSRLLLTRSQGEPLEANWSGDRVVVEDTVKPLVSLVLIRR